LTEKEIFQLIFVAGFSTAAQITGVSGRGVGMDVVKRCVEALRGSIDIGSTKGFGTTITLRLPLTLAIIDGLLVKIADGDYVLPLSAVEECVELTREQADRAFERSMMNFRGKILPFLSLRKRFRVEGQPPAIEQVVVADADGERVGLGVDQVIGQHQTVIKTMSKVYKDVKAFSGATILGDGTVAMILDVQQLIQTAEKTADLEKLLN
jgi:two-component system chemotaxis sensor kinase CheA